MESTTEQLNRISATIAGLTPSSSSSPSASATSQYGSPATAPSALPGISPPSSQLPTTASPLDLAHANPPAAPVDQHEGCRERTKTRSLTLHGGRVLEFSDTDVKSPPAVSFATELPLLNAMWDDESPRWCERSYLVIKGVPIPVKYWKDVYSRTGQWKTIKGNWSQWKVHFRFDHSSWTFLIIPFPKGYRRALATIHGRRLLAQIFRLGWQSTLVHSDCQTACRFTTG